MHSPALASRYSLVSMEIMVGNMRIFWGLYRRGENFKKNETCAPYDMFFMPAGSSRRRPLPTDALRIRYVCLLYRVDFGATLPQPVGGGALDAPSCINNLHTKTNACVA